MQPRLQQVAQVAGVSVSTASRVLNKTATPIDISAATVAKVQAAARTLGYRPSPVARALRTGKSRTIGVWGTGPQFFLSHTSAFHSQAMRGILLAAVEGGYHVTLLTGLETTPPDVGLCDGLLVINRDLDPDAPDGLAALGVPAVYALSAPTDTATFACLPDDEAGGYEATAYLLACGHRRIAFVRRAYFKGIFDRREAGWRSALEEAGIRPDEQQSADVDAPDTVDKLSATAAVCANTPIARALHRLRPDIEIVKFSVETAHSEEAEPSDGFAAVTYPLSEVAAAAVRLLLARLEGTKTDAKRVLFSYTLRPRRPRE